MAKKLNQITGMPRMNRAFHGWFNEITIIIITSVIVDYETVNTEQEITFKGTIQPLSTEDLQLKPEQERSWKWLKIHCFPDFILSTGDYIVYDSVKYRVKATKDYSINNFMIYELVEAYE